MQTKSTLTFYVKQTYGSQHLTEVLFVLGWAPLTETNTTKSYITVGSSVIEFNSFTQILFDNADFNVRTILRNGLFKYIPRDERLQISLHRHNAI